VPLAALLLRLLKSQQAALSEMTAQIVRRFSISSLIAVAILWLTGLINGFFLVGSIQALLTSTDRTSRPVSSPVRGICTPERSPR